MGVQDVIVAAVPPPLSLRTTTAVFHRSQATPPIVYGLRLGFSLHDSLTMALLACGGVAYLQQWMHLYPLLSGATTRCGPQVRISPSCRSLIGLPRTLSRVGVPHKSQSPSVVFPSWGR